jgi:hypothetical protein
VEEFIKVFRFGQYLLNDGDNIPRDFRCPPCSCSPKFCKAGISMGFEPGYYDDNLGGNIFSTKKEG